MFGLIQKIFGTQNERELKKLHPLVDKINALDAEFAALSDDEIKARIGRIRQEVVSASESAREEMDSLRERIATSTSDQEKS